MIVSSTDYLTTNHDFKNRLLPLMDRFVEEGKWKKLVEETTGRYYLNQKPIIWKFQVIERYVK